MALKLKPNPTFWAKVKFFLPGEEALTTISVEFKHMDEVALSVYQNDKTPINTPEALRSIAVGWKDVEASFEDGEEVKALFSNYAFLPRAIVKTFIDELYQAKRGN